MKRLNWQENVSKHSDVALICIRLKSLIKQDGVIHILKDETIHFVPSEHFTKWEYQPVYEATFALPLYVTPLGYIQGEQCNLFVFESFSLAEEPINKRVDIVLVTNTINGIGGLMVRKRMSVPRDHWREKLITSKQLSNLRKKMVVLYSQEMQLQEESQVKK